MKEINAQLTKIHQAKALAQSKADGKGKKKVGKVLKVDSAKDDYGWYRTSDPLTAHERNNTPPCKQHTRTDTNSQHAVPAHTQVGAPRLWQGLSAVLASGSGAIDHGPFGKCRSWTLPPWLDGPCLNLNVLLDDPSPLLRGCGSVPRPKPTLRPASPGSASGPGGRPGRGRPGPGPLSGAARPIAGGSPGPGSCEEPGPAQRWPDSRKPASSG
jgi:hypothetical protein